MIGDRLGSELVHLTRQGTGLVRLSKPYTW
jgi:hypothetical protein